MRRDDDQPRKGVEEAGNRGGPPPIIRSVVGGTLMGLANLVPGVSGGTMILVTGLYDEFIDSLADITRFRFTKRNLIFLAIIGASALIAVAGLAGTLSRAVTLHRDAMFSLFIGLTLGGVPLLLRMIKKPTWATVIGVVVGFIAIAAVALAKEKPPVREAIRAEVRQGRFVIQPDYPRDVASGALGMSAMVLPGVSGAYMLLVLDRYETILAAISETKHFILSSDGRRDAAVFLRVIIPTSIGAIFSLVLLSNSLKWLLRRHEQLMLGVLLGILLGSVLGIWPFDSASTSQSHLFGIVLAAVGYLFTASLSRISA